jgi:unsaturated chondroitin disaccharide hydrolase
MATRLAAVGVTGVAAVVLGAAASVAHGQLDDVVDADLEVARARLAATAATIPEDRYPARTAAGGAWETTGPRYWTSGFFPATLWLAGAATGDAALRSQGEARLAALESQKRDTSGSDHGFKLLGSFGRAFELTGRDRYRRVGVRGARSLASRFGPAVGATRSWGRRGSGRFTVIVDNLMNLELLFWAARHGGNPAWHGMAHSHALRTLREHVRPDGSTFHVVDFDRDTGRVRRKRTRQGHSPDSTWSRGQAWAVYGFTVAYRETGDERLLDAARRTADWFLAHLPPDRVPYWDFDAPGIPDAPRDSSAAAIAASGLLELAALDPDAARRDRYREAAEASIRSLSTGRYLARDEPTQALLLHGTQDLPRGSFDTGLVFGDHYFVEALARYLSPPRPLDGPTLEIEPGSARLVGRRLRVTVEAAEPGRVRAALLPGRAVARRLGLRNARSAVLSRGRERFDRTGTAVLRIRLDRRSARRLKEVGRGHLTLSLVLAGGGGHASATSATVPLGRASRLTTGPP